MSFYPGLGYQGGQSHNHGGYLPPQQPHPPQGYGSPPPQVYPLSLLTLYSSSDVSGIDKERRQGGFGGFGGYGPPQAPPSPQPRHDYNRPPSHSPQPPFNGGYNVSVGDALVGYDDADLEHSSKPHLNMGMIMGHHLHRNGDRDLVRPQSLLSLLDSVLPSIT
jgi:hypothetical protein